MSIQHSIRYAVERAHMPIWGNSTEEGIRGTNNADTILGLGGSHHIFGFGGDDHIYGGNSNDWIYGDSGNDTLYGNAGIDHIYGGFGADRVHGGDGNDIIYGEIGDDVINGNEGNDEIYGGPGSDNLYGNANDDWIEGGTGWDQMKGGTGRDTFAIAKGDSPYYWKDADVITDFNTHDDRVLFTNASSPIGNPNNYFEDYINSSPTQAGSFATAWGHAMDDHAHRGASFLFYTDGRDGFLFADSDHNGKLDTGIILEGLTNTSQFDWHNIA